MPGYFNILKTDLFESPNNSYIVDEWLCSLGLRVSQPQRIDFCWTLLSDLIEQQLFEIDRVVCCLHRKICSPFCIGSPAPNFSNMWLEAGCKVDAESIFSAFSSDLLLPRPLVFSDGLIGQYSRAHSLTDYLRLLAIAIEAGLLTSAQALEFNSQKLMCWALPVGALPVQVFLPLAKALSSFVMAVTSSGFQCCMSADSYQRRCLSFFVERLASYLLVGLLLKEGYFSFLEDGSMRIPSRAIGYLVNMSDGELIPKAYIQGES